MDHDDPIHEMRAVGMTGGAALSRVAETVLRNMQERRRQQQVNSDQEVQEAYQRMQAQSAVAEQHFAAASRPDWMKNATATEQAQTWKAAQQWRQIDPDRFGPPADRLTTQVRQRYGTQLTDTIDRLGADGADISAELIELAARRRADADEEREDERDDRADASREGEDADRERTERRDATSPQQAQEHQGMAQDATDTERDLSARADDHDEQALHLDGQADAYDTAARRERDDASMRAAGVPDWAREAKMTADHGNGADPRSAAKAGAAQRTSGARGRGPQQARRRTRSGGRAR